MMHYEVPMCGHWPCIHNQRKQNQSCTTKHIPSLMLLIASGVMAIMSSGQPSCLSYFICWCLFIVACLPPWCRRGQHLSVYDTKSVNEKHCAAKADMFGKIGGSAHIKGCVLVFVLSLCLLGSLYCYCCVGSWVGDTSSGICFWQPPPSFYFQENMSMMVHPPVLLTWPQLNILCGCPWEVYARHLALLCCC